jgi:hypothetical protein
MVTPTTPPDPATSVRNKTSITIITSIIIAAKTMKISGTTARTALGTMAVSVKEIPTMIQ